MRQTKRKQKTLFSALAFKLGLLGVCAYLVVSLVTLQMDIVSKRQQLENITQQVQTQQATNEELRRTLDADDEASYMERLARDKLGYALPGERVFVDMSGG
jgi:cell division protein DivIC